MEIARYSQALATQTVRAFTRAIDGVPHCFPVTASDLNASLSSTEAHFGRNKVRAPETLVALESGRVTALATSAFGTHGERPDEEMALIRMLWYERGQRVAGQALLERCEERLWAAGFDRILAFHPNFRLPGYHTEYAALTDRWDHVRALLGLNGYDCAMAEVILDWPQLAPPDPRSLPTDLEVRIDRTSGAGLLPDLRIQACRGDEVVGTCESVSAGTFASNARAQDWLFTTWIGVDEEYQGRGMGRHLLLRALHKARETGYRHAAISADGANPRAILFYGNIGYRAVDWTTRYCKRSQ